MATTMPLLVVGGGLIGSQVARTAAQDGFDVRVLTRSCPRGHASMLLRDASVTVADCSTADLDSLLDGVSDVVWCLGSLMPGEAECEPESDRRMLLEPLERMLAAARRRPAVTVTLVTSGGTAYGDARVIPTPEDVPAEPRNHYGRNRVEAERIAMSSADRSGHGLRVLRVANVYGPGQRPGRGQGFLGYALHSALTGTPLTLFGTGGEVRDFVLVQDVAAAITALVANGERRCLLNVGGGRGVSLLEAIQLVRDVTGMPVTIDHRDHREFDLDRVELDIARIRALIGYTPTDLREGLTLTWSWLTGDVEAGSAAPRPPEVA